MEKFKPILRVLLYLLLVMILAMQVLGMVGTALSSVTELTERPWLIPLWITAVCVITASLALCKTWKQNEKLSLIPVALGIVGAAMAVVVALTLQGALPEQVAATNISKSGLQGLNAWKLLVRHYSLAIVSAVTAIVGFVHFKNERDERIRKENESYVDRFTPDADPTMETPAPRKKLSKKQRKELREKQESGK